VIERLARRRRDACAVHEPKGPLAGKKLVLTGGPRRDDAPEAQRRIEALGGRVVSSVSKETDYVVVGSGRGSKLKKGAGRRREDPRRGRVPAPRGA
jgi:NAD-dependent DNA ligase